MFYLALVLSFCCFFKPVKGPTYTAVLFLLHHLTDNIKMCSELILLMVGKEVVDHICDRGSALNLLPESSQPAQNCRFPLQHCFLWQFCRKAKAKSNFRGCYPCPADEVIVALYLWLKNKHKKFDFGSINRGFLTPHSYFFWNRIVSDSHTETTITHVIEMLTKLFPGSISVMYIAPFTFGCDMGQSSTLIGWSGCFCLAVL